MKHKYNFLKPLTLLAALGFSLLSCSINPFDAVSWDTEVLTPVAHASAGVRDLVQDSDLQTDGQGVLYLLLRDTIAELKLRDLAVFPDTVFSFRLTLDSLDLSTEPIVQSITMGSVARQLVADGNPIGLLILANQGGIIPSTPPISGLTSGPIPIDASSYFQYAEIKSGELALTIENEFPLDIDSVVLEIANASNLAQPLISDTFYLIPAHTSVSRSYPLVNQVIESQLQGELVKVNLQAGVGVPIDTNDYIRVNMQARNLRARTATAVFPAQTLTDTTRSNLYDFSENGLEITEVIFSGGNIRLSAVSTMEDSIRFFYSLPRATNAFGEIPEVNLKVLPAPPNGITSQTELQNLAGFALQMDGGRPPFNLLTDRVRVDLLYSGNLVNLNENDSLVVSFGLVDLEPIFMKGFFGKNTYNYKGSERFTTFKGVDIENLNLTAAHGDLVIANQVGMEAELIIKKLQVKNSITGASIPLAGAATLAGPVALAGQVWPDTQTAVLTRIPFNADNSNLNPLISLQPDYIDYDIDFKTNPHTPAGYRDNFATANGVLGAYIDLEVPLIGSIGQWTIRDTSKIDFGSIDLSKINGAILRVKLSNEFPLETDVTLNILNGQKGLISSLSDQTRISAATTLPSGLTSPSETVIEKTLTNEEIKQLLSQGDYLSLYARLRSKPDGSSVKILDSQRVDAWLSVQFKYRVEP